MELGLCSFVEVTPDPVTGALISPEQRLRDLMEETELADQLGLAKTIGLTVGIVVGVAALLVAVAAMTAPEWNFTPIQGATCAMCR